MPRRSLVTRNERMKLDLETPSYDDRQVGQANRIGQLTSAASMVMIGGVSVIPIDEL